MVNETRLELAEEFLSAVKEGNDHSADEILKMISVERESRLFEEIGKLTREFHDALHSIQDESSLAISAEYEIPEAKERLSFVIEKTKIAADKTLDTVEQISPITKGIMVHLEAFKNEFINLKSDELTGEEFEKKKNKLIKKFDQIQSESKQIQTGFNDIVLAQDFQDITGQVIIKVIEVVQNVEDSLVNLLKVTGVQAYKRKVVSEIEAGGPQMNADKKDNVLNDQDEVDSLLSSLGF